MSDKKQAKTLADEIYQLGEQIEEKRNSATALMRGRIARNRYGDRFRIQTARVSPSHRLYFEGPRLNKDGSEHKRVTLSAHAFDITLEDA